MKVIRILIVMVVLSLYAVPVMASTSEDVTITATPMFTAGITSFTITYINDTQLDLAWTVDGTVTMVMIRAKYGRYPADIPNEDTTPSDGYLVYYGNGLAVSDTSMNFDENLGIIHYKVWAQKADGRWYVNTSTGSKESKQLVFIGMIFLSLGILGSGLAFKKSWILWLSIPFWLMLSIYMAYYQTWFPADAQHSLIFIGIGATLAIGFAAIRMQAKPMKQPVGDDTLDDVDNDLVEYQKDVAQWNALSATYRTKTRPRRMRYP
jgi:hypothetical protein